MLYSSDPGPAGGCLCSARGQFIMFALFFAGLTGGCVSLFSAGDADGEQPEIREVLRIGRTVEHTFPLPSMTLIWSDRIRGDQLLSTRLAFRGWDINKDGAFDMLEALGPDGQWLFRAYDLNFDGIVDETEGVLPEDKTPPGKKSARLEHLLKPSSGTSGNQ